MKKTVTIGEATRAIEAIRLLSGTSQRVNGHTPAKLTVNATYWLGQALKQLEPPVDERAKPFFELRAKYADSSGKVSDPEHVAELNRLDQEIGRTEVEVDLHEFGISEIKDTGDAPGMVEALGQLHGIILKDS